ncbi:MAG TPA: hypothetical protein VMS78_01955 [Rhizomicrobium sp.]|nr:hypothetical protein [Rhizomicrobium sp.]
MPERDEREAFLSKAVEEHTPHRDHAHACARDDQKIRARKTLAHSQNGIAVRPVDFHEPRKGCELHQNKTKKGATEHASAGGVIGRRNIAVRATPRIDHNQRRSFGMP